MREIEIEKYLVERVKALGGVTAKMTVYGRRGWPDRLVVLPGHTSLVELKKPQKGRLSVAQALLLNDLRRLGADVVVLRSIEAVDKFIEDRTP